MTTELEARQSHLLWRLERIRYAIEHHEFDLASKEASTLEIECSAVNRLANQLAEME